MLLPRKLSGGWCAVLCSVICALHGLSFGTLYAPMQMILFLGGDFERTLLWIAAGFSFDLIHALGNLCLSVLVMPLTTALRRVYAQVSKT